MQTSSSASSVSGTCGVESRRPVASNVPISEKEFWLRVSTLRDALVSRARQRVGYDAAEDIAQTAILQAECAWRLGRYSDPTEKSGPSAFAGWLMKILGDCCVNHVRTTTRRARHETNMGDEFSSGSETFECRWAILASEDDRAATADMELLHEARQRAAHADLTEEERYALQGRLEKRKLREMSAELEARARAAGVADPKAGTSASVLSRAISRAILKLKAVPADALSAPDIDRYAWRVANDATIYRAPTKTGSALSREKHRLTDNQFQRLQSCGR